MCLTLAFLFLLPTISLAENRLEYNRRWGKYDISQRSKTGTPRIALALSGGGARGLASIGVLRAFDEKHIEIVGIAGTSMGGVVGGLYAVGYSPDEIEDLASSIDFGELFSNSPARRSLLVSQRESRDRALITIRFDSWRPTIPRELSAAQQVTEMLSLLTLPQNYAARGNFSRLETPFKSVATDIVSGKAVLLDSGDLALALRATMAFPLAFAGVEKENSLLMDGGMLTPLPVEQARSFVSDNTPVVAVNTTSSLASIENIRDPFSLAVQVTTIMSNRELQEALEKADYVVAPELSSFGGTDFATIDAIINSGYNSALIVCDEIIAEHELKNSLKRIRIKNISFNSDTDIETSIGKTIQKSGLLLSMRELDSILEGEIRAHDLIYLNAHTVASEQTSVSVVEVDLYIGANKRPDWKSVKISVEGSNIVTASAIRGWLDELDNTPATILLDSLAALLKNRHTKNGFDFFSITQLEYIRDEKTLYVKINPGIVSHRQISGLERTRESFVIDRMYLSPGEPITLKSIENSYRDIYGSGLFRRVSLQTKYTDSGAIFLADLKEQNSVLLRLGYRWDDEYQSEGYLELLENNVMGVGLEVFVRTRLADRRKSGAVGLRTARFLRTYVAFDIEAYFRRVDRILYNSNGEGLGQRVEERAGVEFTLGQQIARLGVVSAGIGVERVDAVFAGNEEEYDLRRFMLGLLVENFDRASFPRRGNRYSLSLETAGKIFGGNTEFTKWTTSLESYIPLGERWNIHPRFFAGGSRSNLPSPERFYLGGTGSFEGFRREELSGEKAILFNLELRYQAFARMYFTAKYNSGNTFVQTDDIKFDKFNHGWAAGVGFDTPLGPITFVYGRASQGRDRVHFDAGLRF